MLASGNGTPENCIKNLLSLVKAENSFARDKGIRTDYIDRTVGAEELLSDSIEDLIDTYEPRITGDTITIDYEDNGNFNVNIEVSEKDGEEDWQ